MLAAITEDSHPKMTTLAPRGSEFAPETGWRETGGIELVQCITSVQGSGAWGWPCSPITSLSKPHSHASPTCFLLSAPTLGDPFYLYPLPPPMAWPREHGLGAWA